MIPAPAVDFYFGPGSRYSYLASTQLDAIAARTGARFRWRPVFSPDLFIAAGVDPFGGARTGQYSSAYRDRDARRWAALYGVPYHDPALGLESWRRIALALVAAGDQAEPLARAMFDACFARNAPPTDDDGLCALAARVGISDLRLDAPDLEARARAIIDEAAGAGVFGVPSFVTGGALFFGNDRLALLERHLQHAAQKA